MNHERYREHEVRIRTSLQRHVGESPMTDDELFRRAEQVYRARRGVYFTPAQLKAMPEYSRRLIEAEAKRLYGQ